MYKNMSVSQLLKYRYTSVFFFCLLCQLSMAIVTRQLSLCGYTPLFYPYSYARSCIWQDVIVGHKCDHHCDCHGIRPSRLSLSYESSSLYCEECLVCQLYFHNEQSVLSVQFNLIKGAEPSFVTFNLLFIFALGQRVTGEQSMVG